MASMVSRFECLDPPVASGVPEEFFCVCFAEAAGQIAITVEPSTEFDVAPKSLAISKGHNATTLMVSITRKTGSQSRHAIVTAHLGQIPSSAVVRVK